MLNYIKEKINEKKSFLEAATFIVEDITNNLDDTIVLGEENESDPSAIDPEINEDDGNDNDNDSESQNTSPEQENDNSTDDNTSEGNSEDTSSENEDENENDINNDIMDNEIEPFPDDGLPTIIGKQTGEPANIPNDILDAEIDLSSNTLKDILPVPPSNAEESIAGDDILNQRVDSGFEESFDVFEIYESMSPDEKEKFKRIKANISDLIKDIKKLLKENLKSELKEINEDRGLFKKIPYYSAKRIGIGTKKGPKFIKNKLIKKELMEEDLEDTELNKFTENFRIWIQFTIDGAHMKKRDNDIFNMYNDAIYQSLDSLVSSGKINKNPRNANSLVLVLVNDYKTTYNFPLAVSKEYILNGVDKSFTEFLSIDKLSCLYSMIYESISSSFESEDFMVESNGFDDFWSKYFSEGISLNGNDNDNDSESQNTSPEQENDNSTDDNTSEGNSEDTSSENEDENDVTTAVKDKVSEIDTDFEDETMGSSPSNKELFKKLSDITKTVEDVKKIVIGD